MSTGIPMTTDGRQNRDRRTLDASQQMRDDDSLHLNSEDEAVVRGRSSIFGFIESSSSEVDSTNGARSVLGNSDNDGHVGDFNGGDFNAGDSNVNRDISDWSITELKLMQEFQEMVNEAKRGNLGALDNALEVFSVDLNLHGRMKLLRILMLAKKNWRICPRIGKHFKLKRQLTTGGDGS